MATAAQATEHIFLSGTMFNVLLNKGIITRRERDGYDLETVRREYIMSLRSRPPTKRAEPSPDSDPDSLDLTEESAKLKREQREKIAMENEIARKTLIPAALVQSAGEKIFTALKAKILASNLLPSEKDDLLNDLRALPETDWA